MGNMSPYYFKTIYRIWLKHRPSLIKIGGGVSEKMGTKRSKSAAPIYFHTQAGWKIGGFDQHKKWAKRPKSAASIHFHAQVCWKIGVIVQRKKIDEKGPNPLPPFISTQMYMKGTFLSVLQISLLRSLVRSKLSHGLNSPK